MVDKKCVFCGRTIDVGDCYIYHRNYYCKYHEPLTSCDINNRKIDWDSVVIQKIGTEEVSILVKGLKEVKK